MSASDFFYISLGVGFLVLIACGVALTWQFWKILSDVRKVSFEVADVVGDVYLLKKGLKVAVLTFVQNMLEKAKGGGDKEKHGRTEE